MVFIRNTECGVNKESQSALHYCVGKRRQPNTSTFDDESKESSAFLGQPLCQQHQSQQTSTLLWPQPYIRTGAVYNIRLKQPYLKVHRDAWLPGPFSEQIHTSPSRAVCHMCRWLTWLCTSTLTDVNLRRHRTRQSHRVVTAAALLGDRRHRRHAVVQHVTTPSSRSDRTRSTPASAPAGTWLITWPYVTCLRRSATSLNCASSHEKLTASIHTRRFSSAIKVRRRRLFFPQLCAKIFYQMTKVHMNIKWKSSYSERERQHV